MDLGVQRRWENSQKGGGFSVGEGAWCWEGCSDVREWGEVREMPDQRGTGRPSKEDGSSEGAGAGEGWVRRGEGSGTALVIH